MSLQKAIVICCIFIILFSTVLANYKGGGDYTFHFEKAKFNCEGFEHPTRPGSCDFYAPLFHWLASPFAFHENAFFYFVLFLLAFVTPMLLYLISKNWVVVWLYFSTTSYFWFFIDGIFAQALAMILILLIIYLKDWRLQTICVLLAALAHGHGFLLALLTFSLKNLFIILEMDYKKYKKHKLLRFLPACSGLFGNNPPPILNEKLGELTTTGTYFNFGNLLGFFGKIFPLPFMLAGIYQTLTTKKNLYLLAIAFIATLYGFIGSHRAFYVAPLVMLPILNDFAISLKGKTRIAFFILTLLSFGYMLYSWLNLKVACY